MVKGISTLVAAAGLWLSAPAQAPPSEVVSLDAAGEPLRSAFNDAAGTTRLIALVAPT